MPPKVKFTRDEIISAALDMVRENGIACVTARALGERLGISSRPIFTAFQNMEELHDEIISAAKAEYNQYVEEGLKQTPAFKGVGVQYIRFAQEEPKLFQLLFMTEQPDNPNLDSVLPIIDENYEMILASVKDGYGLGFDEAEQLYKHLWIYSHGIAALCATKMCRFGFDEINEMLTEVFIGQLIKMKSRKEK